jgi:hypothetical protein
MLHGYGGHILRVDLTSGLIHREKTDPALIATSIAPAITYRRGGSRRPRV